MRFSSSPSGASLPLCDNLQSRQRLAVAEPLLGLERVRVMVPASVMRELERKARQLGEPVENQVLAWVLGS